MTKFAIPVHFTCTKTMLIDAENLDEALKKVHELSVSIERDTLYPFGNVSHEALTPTMMVPEEELDKWPYWSYGWSGPDGCDWRSYRTDKGKADIPDIAEEFYPIPPFGKN